MKDPSRVLQAIPGFGTAVVDSRLEGGVASRSYLVRQNGAPFVLRVDTPEAGRLGLDRAAERRVYRAVSEAGLGPDAVHFDPASGVLIRPFVPGRPWTRDDLARPENLARLAGLLRRLHAVPFSGRRFDPVAAAARYVKQVGSEAARAHYRSLASFHAALEAVQPVLCHNDLVCQNVLEADGPVLIDWEFAAPGDPFFDLAVVVQHHGLGDDLSGVLLRGYLKRPPTGSEESRFDSWCAFYRELLALWELCVASE